MKLIDLNRNLTPFAVYELAASAPSVYIYIYIYILTAPSSSLFALLVPFFLLLLFSLFLLLSLYINQLRQIVIHSFVNQLLFLSHSF